MQREIKFRAWDGERMYRVDSAMWDSERGMHCLFEHEESSVHNIDAIYSAVVMQYTGLKDKNGKEIYEGDILDWAGLKPLTIAWKDSGFVAQGFGSKDVLVLNQEGTGYLAEIIGDIYQNGDLLKIV